MPILRRIDASRARALPGVAAVLTWQDIPRVVYSTAGQSDPIPGPLDTFSLDGKVRFVGDRVALVAAETEAIARQALDLIDVEYELLPAILDPARAMAADAPRLHDEPEYVPFAESDPHRNLAAKIHIDIGDVEKGMRQAEMVIEGDYEVPKVQQASIEPHVVITYWDEDDRLVIRTSTQVPFHVRRQLAPVLGLPPKRIRVIKPRIGGGFGGKQEVLIEDVAAHLTIATGRPVRFEYTREEEFTASRSRHPMRIHMRTGVKRDGTITANEMTVLSDTGAYGCHALTVTGNTGHKAMALYVGDGATRAAPNIRFHADIVYTNTPPAGAFRGYGVPQGFWAVERHMERVARSLGVDPLAFRLKNALRSGELHPFSTAWSEGREPRPETINTCGLEDCVRQGASAIGWAEKYPDDGWHRVPGKPHLRRGIGVAMVMQGTAIPYLDMGGASLKINDDGSFNLLVGATDLGTGSDTVLAQQAAEVLGVPVDDIIVYSSDSDFTPFDKGAYASSTTYISGTAVVHAAQKVAERLQVRAARMLTHRGPGGIEAGGHSAGRTACLGPRWPQRLAGRSGPRRAASHRPGTDHGDRLVRVAGLAASVRGAVRRGHRRRRDRAGDRRSAGDGRRLGRDRQSADRLRSDRGRDDPGPRLRRVRGDAVRLARQGAGDGLRRLPLVRGARDARLADDLRRDHRAVPSVRGEGRGRDPDGRRRAGRGQRHPGRVRRRPVGDPDDTGARVARAAPRSGVEVRFCRLPGHGQRTMTGKAHPARSARLLPLIKE